MKRIAVIFLTAASLVAQIADIRPVPPPGVTVSPEDKKDLEAGLKRLAQSIEKLQGKPLLPDVQIFHEAVRYALTYNEFFKLEDVYKAKELLRQGQIRADELANGTASWTTATGLVVRGFSMGGAAVWHIAAHHAGLWAAAAPGAGFSETAAFLKIWEREKVKPTWWEQKLWHLYDATDHAANFYNIPLVTYSGEIDGQKQAADVMAKALAEEGMQMTHVIGPNTPHRYHPDSKPIINAKLDAIAARGRNPYPRKVRFTTWSLAYNQMKWVTIDSLEQHWERARLDAEIVDDNNVDVKTSGVSAFTLDIGPGGSTLNVGRKASVTINGQKVAATAPMTDRSWTAHFRKTGATWASVDKPVAADGKLHKIHNLQGPIDDAFLDSFVVVRPTGDPMIPAITEWLTKEQAHMIDAWRKQFRGDAQVRDDAQITEADIANSNLILFGDPGSNKLLARILGKLPLQWSKDSVVAGKKTYSSATHVPVMIYPNPLNPKKYIVINSGFTFREYDYLNNARQTPKLPDYAVVDISTPPDGRFPGKIVDAGFFGEHWEFKPSQNTQPTRTD